jgi:hypothetical protein
MRYQRLRAATVSFIALLSVGAAPASADKVTPGGADDSGTLVADVSINSGGWSGGGGGGGSGPRCQWVKSNHTGLPDYTGYADPAAWPRALPNDVVVDLYAKYCPDENPQYVEVPQTDVQADLMPMALHDIRTKKLPKPEPEFLALDSQFGWAYVTVPVDFRMSNTPAPVSVTASIGPVWATVTAVPSRITFDPGEPRGHQVSCSAPGASAGYDPAVPGECSYTYVDSSAIASNGRTFTTTMGVEWSISWTSSSAAGGSLPAFTTSSSTPLAVAEIQALVTCTGSRPEQGGC